MGLKVTDPEIDKIIEKILSYQSEVGPIETLTNIPTHFGSNGKDQFNWMLCNASVAIHSQIKFGLENDSRIQGAIQYLARLVRENGWHCAASPMMGKFKGPGCKDDPCLYANLVMLKALS